MSLVEPRFGLVNPYRPLFWLGQARTILFGPSTGLVDLYSDLVDLYYGLVDLCSG